MNLSENPKLKKLLLSRWTELSLKPAQIMDDAMERAPNMHFARSNFSRWKNETLGKSGNKSGWFTDVQIIWLCTRWGIDINLNFGKPFLNDKGGLEWKVQPYNELVCIQNLKNLPQPADVKKKPRKVIKKK